MSHSTFNPSDSQNIANNFDAGDAHLASARQEITSTGNIGVGDSMRLDTSASFLPSARFENNSIVFAPATGNESIAPTSGTDGHNHNGAPDSDSEVGIHTAGDGHNHSAALGSSFLAAKHTTNAEHSHQGGSFSNRTLTQEQLKMSQEAARLGLDARDIAMIEQLGTSVPHTSARELAERLKVARGRGGILDLSKPVDHAQL
jgi:hypothetical protein